MPTGVESMQVFVLVIKPRIVWKPQYEKTIPRCHRSSPEKQFHIGTNVRVSLPILSISVKTFARPWYIGQRGPCCEWPFHGKISGAFPSLPIADPLVTYNRSC